MKTLLISKYFKIVIALLIVGLIFGFIYGFLVKDVNYDILTNNFDTYIKSINNNNFNYYYSFFDNLFSNVICISIIWISSILFIFFPINIFLNLYKGFSLGLFLSVLLQYLKVKGIYYYLILFLSNNLLNTMILIVSLAYSYNLSIKLYAKYKNNESINIKSFIKPYIKIYVFFVMLTVLSVLITTLINLLLINKII